MVDDEDYQSLVKHKWTVSSRGYAFRNTTVSEGRKRTMVLMHRVVMKAEDGQIIDHINRNRLDNRKNNLRFCTNAENLRNRPKKGCTYQKDRNKWAVSIRDKNGKKIFIGRYDKQEDAVKAFNDNVLILHGEFAVKSSLSI